MPDCTAPLKWRGTWLVPITSGAIASSASAFGRSRIGAVRGAARTERPAPRSVRLVRRIGFGLRVGFAGSQRGVEEAGQRRAGFGIGRRDADELGPVRRGLRQRRQAPAAPDHLKQMRLGSAGQTEAPLQPQERGRHAGERALEPDAVERARAPVEQALEGLLVRDRLGPQPARSRPDPLRTRAAEIEDRRGQRGRHGLDHRDARREGGERVPGGRAARRVHEVALVEHEEVGGADLAGERVAQARVGGEAGQALGIRQHDDAAQDEAWLHQGDLRDGARIADAARLDDDVVEGLGLREDAHQRVEEAVGEAAADAAIGQPQGLAVMVPDQARIDVDRPEIVDQHRVAALRAGEQPVQQRRLAGSEEAADDRERAARRGRGKPAPHAGGTAKTRPPSTVAWTGTSLSASGGTSYGSASSTAKSANFPASMEPTQMVHPQGVGGPQRHGVQGLGDAQPLLGAEQAPRRRGPVDGAPGGEQRPERRHRGVRMDRQRDAEPRRAPGGVDPGRPFRSHRQVVMGVAPVIEVVREQVEAQAQGLDPPQLRLGRHLAVLKGVPMVGTGMGDLRLLDRVEGRLGGLVAVGVDVKLDAGGVVDADDPVEILGGDVPEAVRSAVVIARRQEPGGEALDRPVDRRS
jgi:hypothetical protein